MSSERNEATKNAYSIIDAHMSPRRKRQVPSTTPVGSPAIPRKQGIPPKMPGAGPSTTPVGSPTVTPRRQGIPPKPPSAGPSRANALLLASAQPERGLVKFGDRQKRKPVPSEVDPDKDDAMQGKDIPTVFKRQRNNKKDDAAGASEIPRFAPLHPQLFMFDGINISVLGMPGALSGAGVTSFPSNMAQLGANQGAPTGAMIQDTLAPRAPPKRRLQEIEGLGSDDEESEDEVEAELHNDVPPTATGQHPRPASSAAHNENPPTGDKGKGRAAYGANNSGPAPRDSTPGSSTFAKTSEVAAIQDSLSQLNNNMGRLVNLVGEQTKFFSTMQARGWPPRSSGSGEQPRSGYRQMEVDPADIAKLKRRVARDPKPSALPTTRNAARNVLLAEIRKITRELMGRRGSRDAFYEEYMASDTDVEDFDPENGPAITVEEFRPDLAATPATPYNISVSDVFTDHFVSTRPDVDKKEVFKLFQTHLKYLCNRYKESARGAEVVRLREKRDRMAERQRGVWHRRLAVSGYYPELKKHIPILLALGARGMSEDESDRDDGGRKIYCVLKKPWRHPALTAWLMLFDRLYLISRIQTTNGSQPHARVLSNRISGSRPTCGLPENAYDPQWLRKRSDHERRLIEVRMGEKWDFTHPANIQALVLDKSTAHHFT